jgi:hypothetical protein
MLLEVNVGLIFLSAGHVHFIIPSQAHIIKRKEKVVMIKISRRVQKLLSSISMW